MLNPKKLPYIEEINWSISRVVAFYTNRLSAYTSLTSQQYHSCFDYFNIATHVGDNIENILNNRKLLTSVLPKNCQIQWLEQVHGSHVEVIENYTPVPVIADAAITRNKHIALSVMTADCLPILLADQGANEIAVIHAGWRPLAATIIEKTIKKMTTKPNNISVWLGPCIGRTAFEVSEDVRQAFVALSPEFSAAFIKKTSNKSTPLKKKKYLADLVAIAKMQLKHLGIDTIFEHGACTYTEKEKYYSYRRDGQTGRMAAVIALK